MAFASPSSRVRTRRTNHPLNRYPSRLAPPEIHFTHRVGWLRAAELAAIYIARGLDPELAYQVAKQLMAKDALGARARDELGISDTLSGRPVQAAFASAGSFTVGAILPLSLILVVPRPALAWTVSSSSLLFLALLGAIAARAGGSPLKKSILRVTFWGALAMALTAGVGALFGAQL